MRLIDLDQIEYFTLVDKLGVPRYKIEIGEDIGIEEVKAIPIEWIRNYVSIWISEPYKNFVLNMITKWEKENGK